MDDDEMFAMLVAGAVALAGATGWYRPLLRVRTYRGGAGRIALTLTPPVCLAITWPVLDRWAAREVRESPTYQLLFLLGGAAWLALTARFLLLVGLSARDDAIEAGNPAAVIAICAALLATTICYAGANAGEGPTIWTTFIPAAIATACLLLLWIFYELLTRSFEAVTIARDRASAYRLAGWLVAAALILGRAAAGDFQSWHQTMSDLLTQGWPAIPMMLATAVMQRAWRPTPQQPTHPTVHRGLIPMFALLLTALLVLFVLGRPDLHPLLPRAPQERAPEQ